MRRLLAAATLALLVASAGCAALGPGGGGVDHQALAANGTYAWNTSADVTIDVGTGNYTTVMTVQNRSTVGLSAFQRLNERRPLGVEAIQFRYPNGTVVGADAMNVTQNGSATVVTLPARRGQFAYRVSKRGKAIHVATPRSGSYEVILPPDTQVRYPLLGRVQPGGYTATTADGRVHLRWTDLTAGRLDVQYYLVRDLWLFAGVVIVALLAAAAVLTYFWVQLTRLRKRRETVDLEEGGRR